MLARPRETARGQEGMAGSGCAPRWRWPCTPVGILTTWLTLSQVRICGAGRSRIPQASAHGSDTLSSRGPEKGSNCLLASIWREPGGPSLPYLKPQQARLARRHEAKGPMGQEAGPLTLRFRRVWEHRAHGDHQEASGGGGALRRQHPAPGH